MRFSAPAGSQAPERARESHASQVLRCRLRLSPDVATVQTSVVPVGGEPPQPAKIHDVAARGSGLSAPRVNTFFGAEQALVPAGVDDVVPHVRDGHEEVGDLVAVRWTFGADVPGVRPGAGGASGGNEDLALVRQQVWQREGIPGAASP